jgi:hypothetical protein
MIDIDSLLSLSSSPSNSKDFSLSATTLSPSPSHKSSALFRPKQYLKLELETEDFEEEESYESPTLLLDTYSPLIFNTRKYSRECPSFAEMESRQSLAEIESWKSNAEVQSRKSSAEDEMIGIGELEVEGYVPFESRVILPFDFWLEKENRFIQIRYKKRKKMEKEVTLMRLIAQKQENFLENFKKSCYFKREEGITKKIKKNGGKIKREEERTEGF